MMFCAVAACGCAKVLPDGDTPGRDAVRWGVTSVDGYGTKALVENTGMMERSCTPADKEYVLDGTAVKGLGQTVGVWADYAIEIDGQRQEVKDVFKGTSLFYNPESASTDSKWEYMADPAYWVLGGEYVFRAYYPAGELNVNGKLSSAKSLVIEMNTATTQRDMLLAHNSYDTAKGVDKFGNIRNLTDPVMLDFRHGMSAVRFLFKFYDGADGVLYASDALTSCWFETDDDETFALTGFMVYGDGSTYSEGPVQWRRQYSPASGIKFYRWACSDGVPFMNVRNGEATDRTVAAAYSGGTAGGTILTGEEYTRQDGWLVIIPQESTGKTRLCFTTKDGGNAAFSVRIPAVTGTSREKYEADPYPDDLSVHRDAAGTDYIPGWRYTYTISISKTDATMVLDIMPWNRRDSSFDIKFQ